MLLITVAAVGVSIWAIWFRDSAPVLAPDYAPRQLEENAEPLGDDGDEKRLTAGGYNGKFIVLYYDRTSGEKAMINTEIPVTVTVTE